MSRIGKNPIAIPSKTEVLVKDLTVTVKGPLGELTKTFAKGVSVAVEGNEVKVEKTEDTIFTRALWGTVASHIRNMVSGVNQLFVKKLIVEGVGFKSAVSGKDIVLHLGFSHPVNMQIPNGLTVTAEKNVISVSGIDKESVGSFAALIRAKKKPEPYKGKGIHYEDEVVKRKEGKKTS
ncbi:MAG: 50S ribosomal protein L6 [Candidatus Pacebacteria bacterium]|jgi:large subunit ribosomal protein L6|nr:50S ribosomal protein L6 [Candidatus Paceibacterota bacterium]